VTEHLLDVVRIPRLHPAVRKRVCKCVVHTCPQVLSETQRCSGDAEFIAFRIGHDDMAESSVVRLHVDR
jgi:hypothetical protein